MKLRYAEDRQFVVGLFEEAMNASNPKLFKFRFVQNTQLMINGVHSLGSYEEDRTSMFAQILIACLLVAITVAVHAVGLDGLLRAMIRAHVLDRSGFRSVTGMVIGLTCWLIVIHLVEISVWGLFYFWQGCLPDAESAFYFSAVTYTTLGDGSLILPKAWRIFAPIESH